MRISWTTNYNHAKESVCALIFTNTYFTKLNQPELHTYTGAHKNVHYEVSEILGYALKHDKEYITRENYE